MDHKPERKALVKTYREMLACGLGTGSSGNLSLRITDGMLITPSGIVPADLRPRQVVSMALEGSAGEGQLLPSSEWQLHAAIYQSRPDINALVHCHSRYATVLACTHRPIPPLHYMIAITATDEIPLAPYATFGTQALAESVATTLGHGRACLLANHGQVAGGENLAHALRVAREVEELAAMYWATLVIGGPQVLDALAMAEVRDAFNHYGQQLPESG